ncbi:MAG: hypothetical protein R3A52_20620 [Polyangiales bacterium]
MIDLTTGRVVREFDRGVTGVSWVPVDCVRREAKTLLIVPNRERVLDLVDLTDDRFVSDRAPRPQHERGRIDFSRVLISPRGGWIANDAFIYKHAGLPRVWSLDAWTHDPWEPEYGASARRLAQRWYHWGGEMCFVDETTFALWGWGGDDEYLVPAAVLYDVRDGRLVRWFAGPRVRPVQASSTRARDESMVFDEFLFAVHDELGTTVWDVESGERLHTDESLRPTRYHRAGKCFITLTTDGIRVSRLVRDEGSD